MSEPPRFPPLMCGIAVPDGADPFAAACVLAEQGCEAGTVLHAVQADRLRAAIVFAPEASLADAIAVQVICGVGFQNALGALAPPEVAVHLDWDGGIRLNGGRCGALSVAANTHDPGLVPGWLVVGLDLALLRLADAPGDTPEITSLHEEGCGEVDPVHLLEAWARHLLVWLNRWSDEGNRPLHAEWSGLVWGLDEPSAFGTLRGRFAGTDERFGMLLRDGDTTHLVPLTRLLEDAR